MLLRMALFGIGVVGLLIWQAEFLLRVYITNQPTAVGWVINGAIVLLFITGVSRIWAGLRDVSAEEKALRGFLANVSRKVPDPTDSIESASIIASRYRHLSELSTYGTSINHGVLAATLAAAMSTQNSYPKFINGILILTGVFGTIVALSIALVGASDILGAIGEANGMSTVIHGMSTALSTTMTAIVSYLFHGYFYSSLTDAQTRLLSAVEHVTAVVLLPKFQPEPERIANQFSSLIKSAHGLVKQLEQSHNKFAMASEQLHGIFGNYLKDVDTLRGGIARMEELLREGFRLPKRDK